MDEPAGSDSPIDFDPRHVQTFLTRIREDRDNELSDIRQRVEAETAKIRREGYSAARRLARQVCAETRERQRRQHDRFLYKARSELTRERWSVLGELRRRVFDVVQKRFDEAWRDEPRQWAWCRLWIDAASALANGAALDVRPGEGTGSAVLKRIERRLQAYRGPWSVQADDSAPPGLLVSWADHSLDGTLSSHIQEVADEVMEQLLDQLDPTREIDGADQPR